MDFVAPITLFFFWLNFTATFYIYDEFNLAGKYWSQGRPVDVSLQRPQDVP